MLGYFRRVLQIVVLTFVLVFGTLLVLNGLDTPGWSDSHHGYDNTVHSHGGWWPLYVGKDNHTQVYKNSKHGDTIH